MNQLSVTNVRCNNEPHPIATDVTALRFGWRIESETPGTRQTAYRLQVARDERYRDTIWDSTWDSGWIISEQSQFIPYQGPALARRTRYYVRVKVRADAGESAWSDPGWFETDRQEESWEAEFISESRAEGDDEVTLPSYFRREFTVPDQIASARLYATALGVYEVYINGRRVDNSVLAPGWTAYRKRLLYQTYDVTEYLRPGQNAIGAIVGPGWYAGELTWFRRTRIYGDRTALMAELRVVDAVGAEHVIGTRTDSWECASGPIRYSELYHGERFDARIDLGSWTEQGYDRTSSSMPWVPAVVETVPPECRIVPQDGPFVRPGKELKPVASFVTPAGEQVLDFGANITGRVRFSVRGRAGDQVVLSHAEILDVDGNFYTENLRNAECRVEYCLAGTGADEHYEPHFTFQGFRYVRVDQYPGAVDPDRFTAVVLHSELEPTLEFESSHPKLNALHDNILRSWVGNALDIPTDCPQRDERLGWTGDAQVFVGTAAYLTQVDTFFRKWLRDLAAEQRPDGGVPFVVPDVLEDVSERDPLLNASHSSTGWGDAAVICPWVLYRRYGDAHLLKELYPSMRNWVEYIRSRAEDEVYWNEGFHFGDWVALDAEEGSFFGATPNDYTATAYYAYSTGLVAQAAGVLGRDEDRRRYHALREQIVAAFRDRFVEADGTLTVSTQTAHVLALAFDLVPPEHRRRTTDALVDLIHHHGGHLVTGFLGTPLICPVLADNGHLEEAYRLLLREEYPSWLYQVDRGATTIWEHWDGLKPDGTMWSPKMNSFNHYAYGAVGAWMYATVGGIDLDRSDPLARIFHLEPRPGGGLSSCRIVYRSLYGPIEVRWSLDDCGHTMSVDVSIPPNTRARLVLPGTDETLEPGRHRREVALPGDPLPARKPDKKS